MIVICILAAALITLPIVTPGFYKPVHLRGAALCFLLAVPAYYLGKYIPIMGGPVAGILLGILAGLIKQPGDRFQPGIKITSKKVLQGAIVLFGFQMDLSRVLAYGSKGISLILITITAALLAAFVFGKLLKVDGQTATLIGVGTAICGGSAIAAVSPIIHADDHKVASSISTIFIFNVLAAFIFPLVGRAAGLDDTSFGMWAGSAINDTSSVTAAGFAFSDAAGQVATVVKLVRTLMIIPISLFLAFIQSRANKTESTVRLSQVFPWFILGFLATCLLNTLAVVPAEATAFLGKCGKFLIIPAMVAIGLGTDFRELLKRGKRPVLLGMFCSLTTALISLSILK